MPGSSCLMHSETDGGRTMHPPLGRVRSPLGLRAAGSPRGARRPRRLVLDFSLVREFADVGRGGARAPSSRRTRRACACSGCASTSSRMFRYFGVDVDALDALHSGARSVPPALR